MYSSTIKKTKLVWQPSLMNNGGYLCLSRKEKWTTPAGMRVCESLVPTVAMVTMIILWHVKPFTGTHDNEVDLVSSAVSKFSTAVLCKALWHTVLLFPQICWYLLEGQIASYKWWYIIYRVIKYFTKIHNSF